MTASAADPHASVPPTRALPDEVHRQRLIDALADRWNAAVLLVEAPGGYGKTTALAQAIADNESDPSGHEAYFRCRPRHLSQAILGEEILAALGRGSDEQKAAPEHMVPLIASALASFSPNAVCLHLDDVHAITDSADAVELVAGIVRQLPANAHLVIATRELPRLPLARLQAADQVVRVAANDLLFTDDELATLADRHDVDPEPLARMAGWPAMTRLALVAGPDASNEFVVDEVIEQLGTAERTALAVGVLAGSVDEELLRAVGVDVDLAVLARQAPLVEPVNDRGLQVHDLWADVFDDLVDAETRAGLAGVVAERLSVAGRHDEAISVATSSDLWEVARRVLMRGLASFDVELTTPMTRRWLDRFPSEQQGEPELLFLQGMHARLGRGVGHGIDDVKAAIDLFEERGDVWSEAIAGIEYAVQGWLSNNPDMVMEILGKGERFAASGIDALLPLLRMGEATMHEIGGDFAEAYRIVSAVEEADLPREFAELNLRHGSTMAFLLGDAEAGVDRAERLVALEDSARNRFVLATSHFQANDPGLVLDSWGSLRHLEVGNQRDDFLLALFSAMIDASLGLEPDADRVEELAWDRSRERCFVALARAAATVIAGDEAAAASALEARVSEIGLDDPLANGELRRFLPYGYVLSPLIRDHLDAGADQMGPLHVQRRRLAGLVIDLREGRAPDWSAYEGPASTLCALPLPWSVEVASGLMDHDRTAGIALAEYLLSVNGTATHRLLRAAARTPGGGADAILAALPKPPAVPTRITVFGELAVASGGRVDNPNRERVRQLLALLVLRPSVNRDEVVELLWPHLEPRNARQNLATTLNYARRSLEPDREKGEAPFHLRAERDRIWLHRSPDLSSDAWDIDSLLVAAAELDVKGEKAEAMELREQAVRMWSGVPFADLIDRAELAGELAAFDNALVAAAVSLAQWRLSEDRIADAIGIANQLLEDNQLEERAHAVVIAAYLATGDLASAGEAIDDCLRLLTENGLEPTAPTAMLVRRFEHRIAHAR